MAAVTVPRLGWSMEEGTFVEWLKPDGAMVAPGEPLFVLEGDKAAQTIEALDAGRLHLGPDAPQPGQRVVVGQIIAHVLAEGEAVDIGARGASEAFAQPIASMNPTDRQGETRPRSRFGLRSSPRARRVARELGVDWTTLTGSGAGGRVRERDVRAAAGKQSTGRLIPHTPVRRAIAARMVAGVTQAAPVTLHARADATRLVQSRSSTPSPSITALLVHLAAAALVEHPLLQAQWRDEGLFVPDRIDIAVAVDTDAGLLAPVVRAADRLTLEELSIRLRDLAARARAGALTGDDLRDATFTLTNLGMFGVDAFTPILTLPQCAVLGVGRIVREPAVIGDRIEPRDRTSLSLTFDHRVLDGAPAARFLATLRQRIEGTP